MPLPSKRTGRLWWRALRSSTSKVSSQSRATSNLIVIKLIATVNREKTAIALSIENCIL